MSHKYELSPLSHDYIEIVVANLSQRKTAFMELIT